MTEEHNENIDQQMAEITADIALVRARRPGGFETRCENCIYWEYEENDKRNRINDEDWEGECRRYAPSTSNSYEHLMLDLMGIAAWALEELAKQERSEYSRYEPSDLIAHWPLTPACDWCGEFSVRTRE